jgi:hypothetical protein
MTRRRGVCKACAVANSKAAPPPWAWKLHAAAGRVGSTVTNGLIYTGRQRNAPQDQGAGAWTRA